jgi:predicted metal-binding protein
LIIRSETAEHRTPSRSVSLSKFYATSTIDDVHIDPETFSDLCRLGCVNYGKKLSCPPSSPPFTSFARGRSQLDVICFRIDLDCYADLTPYNRVRAANAILKSLIDRELLQAREEGFRVAGSGSCRACRPCAGKTGEQKCKRPGRRIFSLEAMGVNVDMLVQRCFGFPLAWYANKTAPAYTCTVGAILRK